MAKMDIKSFNYDQLSHALDEKNLPQYRIKQIFSWLHDKKIRDFHEMTNISTQLKQYLGENFYINSIKISKKLVSHIDDTVKYLYTLEDGECVETVAMKYHHGYSLCISSEVGCKMGCTFCASTKAGFVRRLTVSEMLDQIYMSETDLKQRIHSVVLMGIGEPLDNYDNLLNFLNIISDPSGRNLSLRRITVSTCGLANKIRQIADQKIPITLSISLHAPSNSLRSQTMPINQKYPMEEVLSACRYYIDLTHRRITFEYACIQGVNDLPRHAEQLAKLLKGMLCHVNLIPVNPIKEANYRVSSSERIKQFAAILTKYGIAATIRRTLGQDIHAACGQLRRDNISL